MASQLSLAEERERRRIATEVHDRGGQTLGLCCIKLAELVESAPSLRLTRRLSEVLSLLKKLIKEVRSLTFELSYPISSGSG